MNHIGTQTIETERLILRRLRPEDAQAMFDNWASDDEVTKFMMWPTYLTLIFFFDSVGDSETTLTSKTSVVSSLLKEIILLSSAGVYFSLSSFESLV